MRNDELDEVTGTEAWVEPLAELREAPAVMWVDGQRPRYLSGRLLRARRRFYLTVLYLAFAAVVVALIIELVVAVSD